MTTSSCIADSLGSNAVPTYARPTTAWAAPDTRAAATMDWLMTRTASDNFSVLRSHHAVALITNSNNVFQKTVATNMTLLPGHTDPGVESTARSAMSNTQLAGGLRSTAMIERPCRTRNARSNRRTPMNFAGWARFRNGTSSWIFVTTMAV